MHKIKDWWYNIQRLFSFRMEIKVFDLAFSINVFCIKIDIKTDFPALFNFWRSIYVKVMRLSKNKSAEIQITFSNNLITGIHIYKDIHSDHTPFNSEISLMGITMIFTVYDHRHWDYEKNKYVEYEEGENHGHRQSLCG